MNSTESKPLGRRPATSVVPGQDHQKSASERLDHWLTRSSPPWKAGLLVAASFMVAGGLLVLIVPEMLAEWLPALANYSPAERTDWIDSVRTGLLGVIAFGTVAAWVTQYRQSVLARTVDEYTEGVRQLSQSTWEQAAAIRDLEGIADSNPELRVNTLQMLAVFVRERAPRTEALRGVSTERSDSRGRDGKRRPEPGVQEALRVIGSHLDAWAPQPHTTKEDVADAGEDESGGEHGEGGTVPRDPHLPSQQNYVSMADVAIDGALLRDAKLNGLNLRRSLMRDVKLEDAVLTGARLRDSVLSDADLERAILVNASLVDAKLNRANLRGADLRSADLRRANLKRAKMRDANLDGAHLFGAVGLSALPGQTIGTPHCLPGGPQCSGGSGHLKES